MQFYFSSSYSLRAPITDSDQVFAIFALAALLSKKPAAAPPDLSSWPTGDPTFFTTGFDIPNIAMYTNASAAPASLPFYLKSIGGFSSLDVTLTAEPSGLGGLLVPAVFGSTPPSPLSQVILGQRFGISDLLSYPIPDSQFNNINLISPFSDYFAPFELLSQQNTDGLEGLMTARNFKLTPVTVASILAPSYFISVGLNFNGVISFDPSVGSDPVVAFGTVQNGMAGSYANRISAGVNSGPVPGSLTNYEGVAAFKASTLNGGLTEFSNFRTINMTDSTGAAAVCPITVSHEVRLSVSPFNPVSIF